MTTKALMPKIQAWETRKCQDCNRERVHYRTGGSKWHCIGNLPSGNVAPCGGDDE